MNFLIFAKKCSVSFRRLGLNYYILIPEIVINSFFVGYKADHLVGGVEKRGLCSVMAISTALFVKDYRERLRGIANDSEREETVLFDYLTAASITKVRSTIEKYSQNTSIAVKPSMLSVTNRQIGYLKMYEEDILVKKVKYLQPNRKASKNYPDYKARPIVSESSNIVLPKVTVEVKNWYADNFFCGEKNEEGAFYDLIHLVMFTDIHIQRTMIRGGIPPEVNLDFMKPSSMDMILFTDNEMKPDNGRVMYKWSYQELANMLSVSSRTKKTSATLFFDGGHFELFGVDPHLKLGKTFTIEKGVEKSCLDLLLDKLMDNLWSVFKKHYKSSSK